MISNVLSHNRVQGKYNGILEISNVLSHNSEYNGILEKTNALQCAESQ